MRADYFLFSCSVIFQKLFNVRSVRAACTPIWAGTFYGRHCCIVMNTTDAYFAYDANATFMAANAILRVTPHKNLRFASNYK